MTVTGTNDQPIVSDVSVAAAESNGLETIYTGQLALTTDLDTTDTHTFQQTGTAAVTTNSGAAVTDLAVAVAADGTYTVDGNFDALAEGETATVTFTYTATDDSGTASAVSEPKTVILTVTGTNDQPIVSDVSIGEVTGGISTLSNETDFGISDYNTTLSTIEITDSGTIQDLNVQINLNHTYDADLLISLIGPNGTEIPLSISHGGSANNYSNTVFDDEAMTSIASATAPFTGTFRPDGALSILDGIDMQGTWTLKIYDQYGADSGTLLSWSMILDTASGTAVYESNGLETIYSGQLALTTDLDTTDTHTFQQTGTATVTTSSGAVVTDLAVTVAADGTYTVNGNFDVLAAGETATVTFQYTATDDSGTSNAVSAPKTVTLTVTGTNDQPVVSDVSVAATETNGLETIYTGQLALTTDLDTTDTHTFQQTGSAAVSTSSGAAVTDLAVSVATDGTYTVNGNFDALAAGETATVTFTYTATDDSGTSNAVSAPKTVTLTVTGTNDQPIVSDVNRGMSVSISENFENGAQGWSNNTTTNGGELTNFLGRFAGTGGNEGISKTFDIGTEFAGKTVTINFDMYEIDSWDGEAFKVFVNGTEVSSTQMWVDPYYGEHDGGTTTSANVFAGWGAEDIHHYSLVATVDANGQVKLGFGTTLDQGISDESWGIDNLTIVTNDIISETNGVQEIFAGQLVLTTDLDITDTHTFQLVTNSAEVTTASAAVITDLAVVVNANGSYSVNGNFDALADGETATVTFQYTATDDSGTANAVSEPKTVTLTVTGTNDVPVAEAAVNGVNEDATITGNVTATDADAGETATLTYALVNSAPTGLTFNTDGSYSFDASSYDSLAAGEPLVLTIPYTATDINSAASNTANLVITITGTNDQPIVSDVDVNDRSTSSTATQLSDVHSIAANGVGSVGYTHFTISEITTVSIAANTTGSNFIDSYLYILRNDGTLSTDDYITRNDDSGPGLNSYLTITLEPGEYIAAVGDFYLGLDEVITGINNENQVGEITLLFSANHDITIHNSNVAVIYETNGIETVYTGVLALTSDLDTTDTHSFQLSGTPSVLTSGGAVITDLGVVVAADGTYTVNGNFDALAAGETATVTFQYTATDDSGAANAVSAPKTVTLTVTGTNDAPTTTPVTLDVIAEDSGVRLITQAELLANAGDIDSTNLTVTGLTISSGNGSLLDNGNGTWTYTPAANDDTSVSFSYTVTDGDKTAAGSATLDIRPVNDAPTTTPVALDAMVEDGTRLITTAELLGNAGDVENDALSISDVVISSGNGSLVNNNNGTWTYTPAANDDTSVSFSYTITDNGTTNGVSDPLSVQGSATLDITPVNDAPVAVNDNYSVSAGVVASSATDGSAMVITLLTTAPNQSVSFNWEFGTTDYLPFNDFAFAQIDGQSVSLLSNVATVGDGGNSGLQSFNYTFGTAGAHQIVIGVSDAGDTGVNSYLTVSNLSTDYVVSTSSLGSVSESGGTWSLSTNGASNAALTTITTPIQTLEDGTISIPMSYLLSNDTDIEGDTLFISSIQNAVNGSATVVGDTIQFTPDANFNGNATFTYTISDGHGGESTATVTIPVIPVNDAPTIDVTGVAAFDENSATTSTVVANFTASDEEDGTPGVDFTAGTNTEGYYAISGNTVVLTSLGVAAVNAGTTLPAISLTATDSGGLTATDDSVTPAYNTQNDAPTITITAQNNFTEDVPANAVGSVVASYTTYDEEGSLVTVTLSDTTNYALDGAGNVTLTAAGLALVNSGADLPAFTLTPNDGTINGTPANVDPSVTAVNDAPVAVDDYKMSGVRAEYYGYQEGPDGANLTSIFQIRTFMSANIPDAIFTPTSINYALGSGNLGSGTNLQTFLGADALSLSADPVSTSDAIIHMNGFITLDAGTYNFKVTADDGYTILIDGIPVTVVDKIQSPTVTIHAPFEVLTGGEHSIEIIYWDQGGQYQFKAEISNDGGASYNILNVASGTQSFVTPEDTALTIDPQTILANDTDAEGDALSIISVSNPNGGTVTLDSNGNVVFTPTPNYNGAAFFDYTISDNNGGSDTARVYLTVLPQVDKFTDASETVSLLEDTIQTGTVLENTIDTNGLALSVTAFSVGSQIGTVGSALVIANVGSLTINSNGSYTFAPVANYSGTVPTATYTVSNGESTDISTLSIVVTPVADALLPSGNLSVDVGTPTTITTSSSDWSISNGTINAGGIIISPASSTQNLTWNAGNGIGVDRTNVSASHDATNRIETGESLLLNLPTYVTSLALILKNTSADTIQVKVTDIEGHTTIQTIASSGNNGAIEVDVMNTVPFNKLELMGDATGYSLFSITTNVTNATTYTYPIAVSLSLVDTDGSENISSILIKDLPTNADLFGVGVIDNNDGTWTISSANLSSLYMTTTGQLATDSNGVIFEPTVVVTTQDGINTAQTIVGGTIDQGNEVLIGTDGNDYIDGGNAYHMINGGNGNDTLVFDATDTLIDGGTGFDTLMLATSATIDFTALLSNPVTNIEAIDMTKNGVNGDITLSLNDVVSMTDSHNELYIIGDSLDKVTVDSTLSKTTETSTEIINGQSHTFDVYVDNAIDPTVTLKVEQAITDTI
ncbi:tandem-95 repeat protein [Sulfuricurvum sp.]|uniref:tandem-95 repeat protein n=1 Tax=Sulfuricurvum sp. TaxID=2025608 RepID=UPI003BB19F17